MIDFPKSWQEVSVEMFVELSTFTADQFETDTDYHLAVFELLTDASDEQINDLDFIDLLDFIEKTRFLRHPPTERKETVNDFTFIGLENLTLGNFIDLETYFSQNYIEKLPNILMTLYRKTKIGDWEEVIFEPMGKINISERIETMKHLPVGSVYGIVSEYLTFRNRFLEKRKALFGMEDEDNEETDIEADEIDETKEEKLQKKWSWELFLFNIAGGDITKIDEITEMNLFFVFNIVGMKKELKIK